MKVYIVIVNYNGWRDTVECLESVFRLEFTRYSVVVCDNGSSDGSLERIREWAETGAGQSCRGADTVQNLTSPPVDKPIPHQVYSRSEAEAGGRADSDPPLVLIDCGENLGFGGGNNVGLRYALSRNTFSHAWLLNNDTVVARKALSLLVARMEEESGAGMCGSTLLLYDNPEQVQAQGGGYYCKWIGLPWHLGRLRTVNNLAGKESVERWMNYVVGASLLVSKQFLLTVGLMEEDFFLYFEELDWALRAKGLFTLAYAPESVVYHKIGASIGTSSNPAAKSFTCDYYNVRNRLFFTRKYYPHALPSIYATLVVALLIRALYGKWERVAMIWRLIIAGVSRPVSQVPQ